MKQTVLFASLVLLASLSPVFAQETPKTAPAGDPQAARVNLYDLSLLHSLQAVNLSADQISILKEAVGKAAEKNKELRKKDEDALREIGAELKAARDSALDGTPLSTTLEAKAADMQKTSTARNAAGRRQMIEDVLTVLWPTLTAAQKKEMDRQSAEFYGGRRVPAAYRNDPKKAPLEEIQKLAAGAYVENVLLDERMPTLLATLKPLKSAEGSSNPAAPPTKP